MSAIFATTVYGGLPNPLVFARKMDQIYQLDPAEHKIMSVFDVATGQLHVFERDDADVLQELSSHGRAIIVPSFAGLLPYAQEVVLAVARVNPGVPVFMLDTLDGANPVKMAFVNA